MAQLIELSEELIHDENDVFTLFFDDGFKVAYVAEKYGDFVLLLLEGEIFSVVFEMFFDEFGHKNWEDVINVMSLFFKGLIFDEVDFGLDERVSKDDGVDENTTDGEKDLEGDLTWGEVGDEEKDGIGNN